MPRVRRTLLNETSPGAWMNPLNQINLVDLVRRTRAEREAQKLMKMMQKTGGKGLGRLFG